MQFKSSLLVAFVLSAVSIAAPAPAPVEAPTADGVSADGEATIFIAATLETCNNANFSGQCFLWTGDSGTCFNFPGDWNDVISSAKPITDGIWCNLFRDIDCNGQMVTLSGPAFNLQEQGFNDAASSFRCFLT